MTKIDIFSGFLGAGKTTLIKKMISESYEGEKLVLIENEFGQIGIDGGFLQDAGINVTEMNSGCICCSLVGDFGKALAQVIERYHPDRVMIEPSGVGKLSDVIGAVNKVEGATLGYTVAVVDAGKVKVYMRNFGEFFNNQVETAATILLSRTDSVSPEKLDEAVDLLREHNNLATIVTTPWDQLTGAQIREAMEGNASLAAELAQLEQEHGADHCHHHDHDHDHEEGHCHHDHDHDHEEGHCCHHDHDHDHEEGHCHHHDHDHDHEEGHCCHHHDHDHHHADEVFSSWGAETVKKYTLASVTDALKKLDAQEYGLVLRAKGIVAGSDGSWIHFDYVPGETNVRTGSAAITGKLCVIGSKLNEAGLADLFGV